jgi:GH15 family glucan-1,4-alpha-glucosidase
MEKAFDKELKIFGQSYEETDVLDSAVLIMPLVFFIQPVRAVLQTTSELTERLIERSAIREHAQADSENS